MPTSHMVIGWGGFDGGYVWVTNPTTDSIYDKDTLTDKKEAMNNAAENVEIHETAAQQPSSSSGGNIGIFSPNQSPLAKKGSCRSSPARPSFSSNKDLKIHMK